MHHTKTQGEGIHSDAILVEWDSMDLIIALLRESYLDLDDTTEILMKLASSSRICKRYPLDLAIFLGSRANIRIYATSFWDEYIPLIHLRESLFIYDNRTLLIPILGGKKMHIATRNGRYWADGIPMKTKLRYGPQLCTFGFDLPAAVMVKICVSEYGEEQIVFPPSDITPPSHIAIGFARFAARLIEALFPCDQAETATMSFLF